MAEGIQMTNPKVSCKCGAFDLRTYLPVGNYRCDQCGTEISISHGVPVFSPTTIGRPDFASYYAVSSLNWNAMPEGVSVIYLAPGYGIRPHESVDAESTALAERKEGDERSPDDFEQEIVQAICAVSPLPPTQAQVVARAALTAVARRMMVLTKEMVLAGTEAVDECIDGDYDSDGDGNRYEYTTVNSDAAAIIFRAMMAVGPLHHYDPSPDEQPDILDGNTGVSASWRRLRT